MSTNPTTPKFELQGVETRSRGSILANQRVNLLNAGQLVAYISVSVQGLHLYNMPDPLSAEAFEVLKNEAPALISQLLNSKSTSWQTRTSKAEVDRMLARALAAPVAPRSHNTL